MINEGVTLTKIAQELNIQKSLVSYYIRKAKEVGYIKEVARDKIKIIELTQPGKTFLDQYDKKMQPNCRAENIRFKASIHRLPPKTPDWRMVEMNNWNQYNSTVDNIKVKLNMGKNPNIEFLPSPIDGNNPWELCGILYNDCTEAARKLEQTLDMQIGRLEPESGSEWVVNDPVADSLCKYNGQITIKGLAKVNASKPARRGAVEYFDPLRAAEYFTMPQRLAKMERLLEDLVRSRLKDESQTGS
jgi:hypothetical protein